MIATTGVMDPAYDGGMEGWIADTWAKTKSLVSGTGWQVPAGSAQVQAAASGQAVVTPTAGVSTSGRPLPVTITPPSPVVYTVKKGDTLSGVARAYGVTLSQLRAWNPQITNANVITTGQKINIAEMVARPTTQVSQGQQVQATGLQPGAAVSFPTFVPETGMLYTPDPQAIQPGMVTSLAPVSAGASLYSTTPAAGTSLAGLLENPMVLGLGALGLVLLLKGGKGKK